MAKSIVVSAVKAAKIQMKIFDEYVELLTMENLQSLVHKKTEFYQFEQLKDIGYSNFYAAYFDGLENRLKIKKETLRSKALTSCWASLKKLEFWNGEGYSKINEIGERFNSYDQERKLHLSNFIKITDEILRVHNGKTVDGRTGEYLTKFFDIHLTWRKTMDRRAHIVHRNLVLPIRILNRKYQDVSITSSQSESLSSASFNYDGMRLALKKGRQQFSLYSANARYFYRTLERILKIL